MNIIPVPEYTAYSNKETAVINTEYVTNEALKKEAYSIKVSDNGELKIEYADGAGKFYAKQTLKQLFTEGNKLPVCIIRDCPKYEYRGFMLDCARHMFSIKEIKKLIDAAALLKLNRFHWHLTDDQGWRIECKAFPELNSVSARRKYSDFGKTYDKSPYGRVYTKDEIKDIVSYCKERFIEVIPEFDIPGHTSALLAAINLTCGKESVEVKTHQGIFKDVICPAKKEAAETVFAIFDEICELFPGKYIHIGGDETPAKQWKECPECRKLMEELGTESFKEYQNYFMNLVISHLEEKGKTCIVWNDAAAGKNLDKRAVVQYWKENDSATFNYANLGGRLILSPFTYYYTDYDYDITPLNRTLSFNPELKQLNDKNCVLGVEVPIWTEYIESNAHLEEMLFPRAAAVAQHAWSTKRIDYNSFIRNFESCKKLLEGMNVKIADESLWKNPRFKMPKGWLRFVHDNYSLDYIKSQLK